MGEAKRRRIKSPESIGKAVVVKIEKSKMTEKWLVVAYILKQRFVVSPFIERVDAENASIEVDTVFNSISYESWRKLRRGDRTVLTEAISKLTFDDDDQVVGLLDLTTNKLISRQQNPQLMEDATEWANSQAVLKSGKPLFKSQKSSQL
jgi:hypothetical protein